MKHLRTPPFDSKQKSQQKKYNLSLMDGGENEI